MSALTSLLVRDEVVSVRQIEDALSRQVLEGGELDTALLELDAAPENVLNAYRAASFRLPAVARDEVMGVSAATLSLVSRDQAEHYRVIPITHDANTLLVATYQPLHEIPRNELGTVIGMRVECCIACEVRIEAALASHYGLEMNARMAQLAGRIDIADAGALPTVEPILETPISGLAAELFDGLDDGDDVVEVPDGAQPIAYESLRPDASPEVSMGRVVEGRPSQLPEADAPATAKSSNAPRATQTGFASAPPAQDTAIDLVESGGGADRPAVPPTTTTAAAAPAPRSPETAARPAAAEALARASGARVANDVAGTPRAKARTPRAGAVPQGPLSRELASQLLERSDDRDAVVEVFFRYARQYFDATALCSIREERVLGREVHNVPNLNDIRGLSLAIARGSALEELSRTLQPRVVDLSRKNEDRPLAEALQRAECQPSALLPVCIQRRVVAMVYGDRGGEFFRQSDLAALIELLPEVSRAFERIIRTRKVLGLSARAQTVAHAAAEFGRAATQLDVVAPSSAQASSPDPAKAEAMLRNARRALSALGAPRTAPPPPGAAARMTQSVATRSDSQLGGATAASAERAVAAGSAARAVALPGASQELDRLPTSRLPAVDAPLPQDLEPDSEPPANPEPMPKPPAYMSKPPPGAGRYSSSREGEGDEPELGVESDTKPLRSRASLTAKRSQPSELPVAAPTADATADTVTSLPAQRFESPVPEARVASPRPSKPPPGTGVYRQQDVAREVISMPAGRRSPQPSPAAPPTPAATGRRSQPAGATSSSPSRPPTDPRRPSKRPAAPDARREDPPAVSAPEYVSQSKTARYSPVPREASVIVDTLGQTHGLIDDLCKCGPDDEGPTVQSLLRVGDAAIDLLIERFPGPLWFDRRRPYARLPFGRDTGPIARALAAFGEAALPKIVPLLRAPSADVRYYAMLFASDRVHPELLVPIAERLFDEDPQIRLMVRDTLPAYRSLPAFAQVLGSLRTRMLETRAPVPARLAAIDGVTNLRDGQAVPALVELLAHADRQLSIPAHRALVAITCQDFGTSTKKWRLWYEDNQHRHRVQWLIESLMHGDQNLRSAAGIELQKVTQVYYGYVATAPKRDRERAQRRYQDWWDGEGRMKLL